MVNTCFFQIKKCRGYRLQFKQIGLMITLSNLSFGRTVISYGQVTSSLNLPETQVTALSEALNWLIGQH